MSDEMAVIDVRQDISIHRDPVIVLAEAQKAAAALTTVLKSKTDPVMINGKQYLEFEDWQTVGRFYGVSAKVVSTGYVEYGDTRGFEARAVAVRGDGEEISAAESMCLDDEERWADRDLFQIKSMAQTRACAKALRNVLAWVVVLGGYGTTPAEEMDGVRGHKLEAKVEKRADGSALVAEVTTQHGVTKKPGKADKPWTKYTVSFDDGRFGTTFDKSVADEAQECKARGTLVIPKIEADAKYTNLVGLEPVRVAEPMLSVKDDEPIGQPEKVLTVRTVTPTGGKPYFVINTDRRVYVTDLADIARLAEELRATGRLVVVSFEVATSPSGKAFNKIVEFGKAPAPAAGSVA